MRKVNETVEKGVLDSLTGLRAVEQENIILDILKKLYKEKYGLPEDVEIAGVRFGTIDSSFFKRQEGNRDVLKNRKNNVKKAIINQKQVNDIVLNENLEIIDGQARTEALEEINIEKVDEVILSTKGYFEFLAYKDNVEESVLRFNVDCFRNNYKFGDLLKMDLCYYGIKVGTTKKEELKLENEINTAKKVLSEEDLSINIQSSNNELPIYDIIIAGVKND